MATRDLRLCPPATLARLRQRVARLAAQGFSRNDIAHRLGLRRATIGDWLRTYRDRGLPGLTTLARGRPPVTRLPLDSLLKLLRRPPPGEWLWTTRTAAARIAGNLQQQLSPRNLLKLLTTSGLLPLQQGIWTGHSAIQDLLADHPRRQPYLATAIPLAGERWGWSFSLLDTTGRCSFLFVPGPLRLTGWIVFLERARKHIGDRAALFLMQPAWLCHRPSVRRWLGHQQGQIIADGVEILPLGVR